MIPRELTDRLGQVASQSPLVVATDYDGVLAPIVDDPARATPDPAALAAFLDAGERPSVVAVVVSGRARADLAGFLGEPDGVILIGNHGADLADGSTASPEAAEALQALADAAEPFPGTIVEAKPHGAAFHYRTADDRDGARDAARRAASGLPGRVIEGKEVLEVVIGEATKGTAIADVRRSLGGATVVYLGDDVTDEDVFRSLEHGDVGIKVGAGPTAAPYRIDDVGDVAAVFSMIAGLAGSADGDG